MTNPNYLDSQLIELLLKSRPSKPVLYRLYLTLPNESKKRFSTFLHESDIDDLHNKKQDDVSSEEPADVYLEDDLIVAKENTLDTSISNLQSTQDMDSFLKIFDDNDYHKTLIPKPSREKDLGKIVQVVKVPKVDIIYRKNICLEYFLSMKDFESN